MSLQMRLISTEFVQTGEGPSWTHDLWAIAGLTANGANTAPFPTGAVLRVPRRVSFISVGNAAAGALASLDTSQGIKDPSGALAGGKLGFDQNNIYLYIGNATQVIADVEWQIGVRVMSARMLLLSAEIPNPWSPCWRRHIYVMTELTPHNRNIVPFPAALPNLPRKVSFIPGGNGAPSVSASLDTSMGAADQTGVLAGGKLGFGRNNIYLWIGDATQVIADVEW